MEAGWARASDGSGRVKCEVWLDFLDFGSLRVAS
jgi:hypothetical protein